MVCFCRVRLQGKLLHRSSAGWWRDRQASPNALLQRGSPDLNCAPPDAGIKQLAAKQLGSIRAMMAETVPCKATGPLLGKARLSYLSRTSAKFQFFKFPSPVVCSHSACFPAQHTRTFWSLRSQSKLAVSQPACFELSKCSGPPPEMGLCSFIRRVLSGPSQRQRTRQGAVAPTATKFGLAAILETQAAPASDLISARPSFLTVAAAKPQGQTTSLTCSPKAPSPPEPVSYQGYFGLHDSVPTLADRKQWMTISGSDMFKATQAWGAASERYWAWVSDNSHALFLAEKEALAQSRGFMARLLQRSAGHTPPISCLTDSCSIRSITGAGCMGCMRAQA